jgi:hypothetical protein
MFSAPEIVSSRIRASLSTTRKAAQLKLRLPIAIVQFIQSNVIHNTNNQTTKNGHPKMPV